MHHTFYLSVYFHRWWICALFFPPFFCQSHHTCIGLLYRKQFSTYMWPIVRVLETIIPSFRRRLVPWNWHCFIPLCWFKNCSKFHMQLVILWIKYKSCGTVNAQ
jgi:hypothetical protein